MHYQKQALRRDWANLKAIVVTRSQINRPRHAERGKKIGRERSGYTKESWGRRRTSHPPEETDEDVSLRVGEFREEMSVYVYVYTRIQRERGEERESQERVDAFRLFLDRPRYPPTCFLGPCFKLFRIINELNRIRACRLPHCPRSSPRTKTSFTSKFTTPGRATLPYLLLATKSEGRREGGKKEKTIRKKNRFIPPRWN